MNNSDGKLTVIVSVEDNCKNDGEHGAQVSVMKRGKEKGEQVKFSLMPKGGGMEAFSVDTDQWLDFRCFGEKADEKSGCTVTVEVK